MERGSWRGCDKSLANETRQAVPWGVPSRHQTSAQAWRSKPSLCSLPKTLNHLSLIGIRPVRGQKDPDPQTSVHSSQGYRAKAGREPIPRHLPEPVPRSALPRLGYSQDRLWTSPIAYPWSPNNLSSWEPQESCPRNPLAALPRDPRRSRPPPRNPTLTTLEDPRNPRALPPETAQKHCSAPFCASCDARKPWSPFPGTLLGSRLGPSSRLLPATPGDPGASGGPRTPRTLLFDPS